MNSKRTILVALSLVLLVGIGICVVTIPTAKYLASALLWRARGRTGTLYGFIGKDKIERRYYVDDVREGIWILYDQSEREISRSEYKSGNPWNGVCWIYDRKGWRGEYRNGNPWHGCLPVDDPATGKMKWDYFICGKDVSYDEYCKEWGVSGPGHIFVGLGHYKTAK